MTVWVVPVVAGPRSQLEPLLCNGIGGMAHYHFSVTPCSTHYAALAHALLTGLLALIVHAILYPGISKVFAVTVKTSQRLCRASERRVEISVVPVCIDPQPCRQVATLGLDFVNFPSLLILSVPQLPDRECCPARIPPPASVQETLAIAICVQMVESPLTRRAASSHRIVWSCRRRRSIISE
jgi:hypothetical protein